MDVTLISLALKEQDNFRNWLLIYLQKNSTKLIHDPEKFTKKPVPDPDLNIGILLNDAAPGKRIAAIFCISLIL